jgi:Uma2 family endonuclease
MRKLWLSLADIIMSKFLPTMYDLPSEDPEEPGLPDMFHGLQPQMLDETLWLPSYPDGQFFSAFNLNVYYDVNHADWHHRPDWFLVLDVPRLYQGLAMRQSYVVWDEPAMPIIVMEFLVEGLDMEELGGSIARTRSTPDEVCCVRRDFKSSQLHCL